MKITKTERGWAGHFICAQDCTFKRNTLVQYGKKFVVVSTVGCMRRIDSKGNYGNPEEIGHNRYYETMSFWADASVYHDADVSNEISGVNSKWSINRQEMKRHESEIDNIANKMHDDYVNKIAEMLQDGSL